MSDKKRFLAECALYIKGGLESVKIRGSRPIVEALSSVLVESRNLHEQLHQGSDMSQIIQQVKRKRAAAQKLRNITGFMWPF